MASLAEQIPDSLTEHGLYSHGRQRDVIEALHSRGNFVDHANDDIVGAIGSERHIGGTMRLNADSNALRSRGQGRVRV